MHLRPDNEILLKIHKASQQEDTVAERCHSFYDALTCAAEVDAGVSVLIFLVG